MLFRLSSLKKNIIYMSIIITIILLLVFFNETVKETSLNDYYLSENDIEIGKLVINEIMTSNKGAAIDKYGDSYDYVEIYNGTNHDINLLNYGLSDKDDGKVKWRFPDVVIKSKSYLLVYLTGEEKEGLYANFSLKKEGGELLTLKKPNGKVIDSIRISEMDSNFSMSRDYIGVWMVTKNITPGYENNNKGREKILSLSKELDENNLYISEILPSNEGSVVFDDNKLYGYIEITNDSNTKINLKDYYLTDDEYALYKWRFPNVELESNSTYLIYTNKLDSPNTVSFELSNENGKIMLTKSNGVVDSVTYSELPNGTSLVKVDDKWIESSNISPGYPNTSFGKIEYQKKYDSLKKDLVINEVMNSNNSFLPQNDKYYDWIELYNNSDKEINLSEYTLTIDKMDKLMYRLPNYVLKPNSYYILMASGDITLSNNEYTHINFKLGNAKGLLLYKDDEIIDSLFIYNIPRGYSYGRDKEYGHLYFQIPTPNTINNDNGIRELSVDPEFSVDGGVYNNVSSLEVKIEGLGDIYYTTNGSVPTANSTKYTNPINIDKTTVIRAVSYENGKANSKVITNSYIINENHTLPVVSISLEEYNYNMIMRDPWANERVESHTEFYDEESSFSIDSGIKIFGGDSRNYNKKSFALKFNKDYEGSLHYKMFDNKDIVEFNDLVLRSGTQEQKYSMIRDEFVSLMAVNYSDVDAQSARPAVLYINGKYQGLFFIREKINNNFVLNNHNIDGVTDIFNPAHDRLENGSSDVFMNLKNYVKNHDMTNDDNYEYVSTILDIDNYIDYYIFEYILCNYDWHNVRMYSNKNLDNGKIKMILYDSDFGLKTNGGANYFDFIQHPWLAWDLQPNVVLDGLFKNEKFKQRFVERIALFMKNVWNEENITKTYDYLYNSIYTEMERESKRWNKSYDNWKNQVVKVKDIALLRSRDVPKFTKQYFNLSDEEYNKYFG